VSGLILYNANVMTMGPCPAVARSIAAEGARISAVGNDQAIRKTKNKATETIDCKGRTVIPAFIDAHCHLAAYAEHLVALDLSPKAEITSIRDIQDKIRSLTQSLSPDQWIRGKRYDEFSLSEKRHPHRLDLDQAAPTHPVKLTHRSGYAHVLNSVGLAHLGITGETADPEDGIIDRDLETGEPTGILYGMGAYLAEKIPPLDDDQLKQGAKLANQELLGYGITSVQDASSHNDLNRWSTFQRWRDKDILKPAITMMLGLKGFEEYKREAYPPGPRESGLRMGGVKIIIHEVTGSLKPARKTLNEMVLEIHRAGLQAVLHAVDERAIEAACDAVEYALTCDPRPDHRHRIEHCSVCPPALAKRIASLGITVVTQPSFIYYSGERYLETVSPEELIHLYPIGTLIESGVRVAAGSDFPVAEPNPLVGVYGAVARVSQKDRPVLPEQGIGHVEALGMYTYEAARASFEEEERGSIEVGKRADLVILSDDLSRVPDHALKSVRVDMTIMGGEIVWRR